MLMATPVVALSAEKKFGNNVLQNPVYYNAVRDGYLDRLRPYTLCKDSNEGLLYQEHHNKDRKAEPITWGDEVHKTNAAGLEILYKKMENNFLGEKSIEDLQAIERENKARLDKLHKYRKAYEAYDPKVKAKLNLLGDIDAMIKIFEAHHEKVIAALNKKHDEKENDARVARTTEEVQMVLRKQFGEADVDVTKIVLD
jgi:hypothetical protein